MPKRIQPSVVIGLGGTGVTTITYLKRTLEEQAADIKQFVRFLAIDIDEIRGRGTRRALVRQTDPPGPRKERVLSHRRSDPQAGGAQHSFGGQFVPGRSLQIPSAEGRRSPV